AYVLGVAEYIHWANYYSGHMSDLYTYHNQLLIGHAPWLVDQSRVLAPLIIAIIQRTARSSYDEAYQHFMLEFYRDEFCNRNPLPIIGSYRLTIFSWLVTYG